MKKKIAILGSTGSIGKTLFNILKKDKNNFEIILLTINKNYSELIKQVNIFDVRNIIITNQKSYLIVKKKLKNNKINIYNNYKHLDKIFKNKVDYLMSSITSLEGLNPTLECIKFTKLIAIANKESIICGWNLIMKQLKKYNTKFIPIDSEHFSIWSLINNSKIEKIEKIFITASGGPFNNLNYNKFKNIKIKDALKHPNWKMGKKITIDSATLMNKVFEIMEAKKIFELDYKDLNILVHEKSYVHAIVKFKNGLTKILIHDTDMKIPIFNSVYSDVIKEIKTNNLNIEILNNLNFKYVDLRKFPVVKILKLLSNKNSLFETVIVSVNDSLVKLFLKKKISFLELNNHIIKFTNLTEFKKYKLYEPKNTNEIMALHDYVSLKINTYVYNKLNV
tara:strand:- start:1106 stop:2284 length:1179 start_codon:yes stop_codon:yes gene_type:complete